MPFMLPVASAVPPGLSPEEVEAWASEQEERAREAIEQVRAAAREHREQAREAARAARESARDARQVERNAHALARKTRDGADLVIRGRSRTVGADEEVGDVLLYGGSLDLQGVALGDVVVFGGNLRIDGEVRGDVAVMGGSLTLAGRVNGDIHVVGGSAALESTAVVRGSLTTVGGSVERAEGARVDGSSRENTPNAERREASEQSEGVGFGQWLSRLLVRFSLLFGLGFLFLMFAPERVTRLGAEMRHHPWRSVGTGFFALLATVPLLIMLCVTLVGIPVAILLLLLLPLSIALGVSAFCNALGHHLPLFRGHKTQALVLALGIAPLVFISSIPVLGVFTSIAVSLLALGALVRTRFGGRPSGGLPSAVEPAPDAL